MIRGHMEADHSGAIRDAAINGGSNISLLTVPIAVAQDNNTQAAQRAAESWLASVDEGNYIDSYDGAASIFKLAITKRRVGAEGTGGAESVG